MTNDDASGLVAGAVQFLPLLIIFMIFYFFIIRKRQPKHKPWTAILTSGSRPGQVTRLLCASAFLGSFLGRITFRYKMLRFFQNKTRATAPELGFDARLVLLACQVASRRAQRYTIVLAGVAFLTLMLALSMGPGGIGVGVVFSWVIWYFKMLRDRTTLIQPFRRDIFDTAAGIGGFADNSLDKKLSEALPSEHQNLLVYANYLPFVGAGIDLGGWSFSSFINKAKADTGNRKTVPFTIEELYTAIDRELTSLNIPMLQSKDWYFVNGVDVHGNRDVLKDVAARPSQRLSPEVAAAYQRVNDRQVRHYKWIRIEDWGGDLVVSYFLRCSRVGESLFVETKQFIMPPLDVKYRRIDSLPERGVILYLTCLFESLVIGSTMLVAALFLTLIMALNVLVRRLVSEERRGRRLRRAMERLTQHNYGAITSMRANLSQPNFLHYFQQSDADLYRKVLERKLLDAIITFLDDHNIDTSEIRERRMTILNSGILVQGGDVRAENLAVGHGSTATKVETAQVGRTT